MKMKKLFAVILTGIMLAVLSIGCTQQPATTAQQQQEQQPPAAAPQPAPQTQSVEILVGAAASLTDVMQELAEVFEAANENVRIEFTFASSGALQTQIEQGAPMDIFMSAAPLQMNNLLEQGLIHGDSRNLLRNAIALIVPTGSDAGITTFTDLAADTSLRIGLGDPETVPGGTRAREIFTSLGIEGDIYGSGREVLAPDIRTVLTWVEMGEVDAGVVFMTDAITTDQVTVVEIADPSLHGPSVNPVGIVEGSGNIAEAQQFIDFLFTPEAAAFFERHGFSMYS